MRTGLTFTAVATISALVAAIYSTTATASTVPPTEPDSAETSAPVGTVPDPAECAAGLTLHEDVLTVATGDPAHPPYVIDDDPASGEGFEAAVSYAVAAQLGVDPDSVEWVRTPFEAAIQPGPKDFDFNIQQYSITEERQEVVTFSLPYYSSNQAIVSVEGSPAVDAATLPELQELRLGVAAGTTSLALIEDLIQPTSGAQVFNDNAAVVQALTTQQIDAIVVDLPTALFLAAVELDDGVIVGQFPTVEAAPGEPWGLLFEKDNPLAECADYAILNLQLSGELEEITTTWMEEATDVPVIDLD